jgi:lysylphosphatidylglycerol synthetase-like protein (DUF2156 family)
MIMLSVQRLSRIGSWSLVIVGTGHLLTDLLTPTTPRQEEAIRLMRDVVVAMPGSHHTLWDYHHGFSLMMGLLLVGYGAVTLAVARGETGREERLAPVLAISSLVCLAALALSVAHFFAIPVLFTAVACASFALAWKQSRGSGRFPTHPD